MTGPQAIINVDPETLTDQPVTKLVKYLGPPDEPEAITQVIKIIVPIDNPDTVIAYEQNPNTDGDTWMLIDPNEIQ